MHCSIRRATEGDAEGIVGLLNPIIRAGLYTIMVDEVSVEQQIAFIRGFPEHGLYNVAVGPRPSAMLGIQDIQPVSAEPALRHVGVISTFVDGSVRRGGVGRMLSDVTLVGARARGFRKIMASVRADNDAAVAFYRSLGFATIGIASDHALIGGRYVDEILMERLLDGAPPVD